MCQDVSRAGSPYGDRIAELNNAYNNAGEIKWRVNAEECGLYWARVRGKCVVCVASCPYNKMDESLAYSKPIEADNFWEGMATRASCSQLSSILEQVILAI
jgi:hypothetical protein